VWEVARVSGPATTVLGRALPATRSAAIVTVDRPALVLGSTQRADAVDEAAARRAGVDVARRRGGGGAVLVRPRQLVWVDVFVPSGDPLWRADASVAFHWVGQAWVDALAAVGVRAAWHHGPLVCTPWSRLVCFGGIGPGEVTVDGRKVVGLSQRRTRAGALFACAALLAWDPAAIAELLRADIDVGALESAAAGLDVDATALERAFVASLPRD
jgi:lipoate-protein ligase A